MVGGQHDLHRLLPQRFDGDVVRCGCGVAQQDVQLAVPQCHQPAGHPDLALPDLDLGPVFAQPAQHEGAGLQVAGGDVDAQYGAVGGAGPHRGDRLVRHGQQPAGAGQEDLAGGGKSDAAGVTDEERLPELVLELLDRRRERLLGEEQLACGSGEVQLLRDGDEVPQVAELG